MTCGDVINSCDTQQCNHSVTKKVISWSQGLIHHFSLSMVIMLWLHRNATTPEWTPPSKSHVGITMRFILEPTLCPMLKVTWMLINVKAMSPMSCWNFGLFWSLQVKISFIFILSVELHVYWFSLRYENGFFNLRMFVVWTANYKISHFGIRMSRVIPHFPDSSRGEYETWSAPIKSRHQIQYFVDTF